MYDGIQQKTQPKLGFSNFTPSVKLFIHNVHCNFKAKTHFSSSRFSPHDKSPFGYKRINIDVLV
jgi:hypothetical protein